MRVPLFRSLRRLPLAALAATLVVAARPGRAAAQPSYGLEGYTLTFLQPTGSGSTTDSFDIFVRLARDASATPFTYDSTATSTGFGLPAGLLPTDVYDPSIPASVPFASYSRVTSSIAFACYGTFEGPCGSPPPYDLQWGGTTEPSAADVLTLAPGGSLDFLFGTFLPHGGVAAPGVYTAPVVWVTLNVDGADAQGQPLYATTYLAGTCGGFGYDPTTGCGFTRAVAGVTAAPEPATLVLSATGLLALAGVARRRRPTA
jgi:hypothetical protein